MNTLIYKIDADNPDSNLINQAAKIIKSGGLVIFPTETVYGLAADAFNKIAVERVFDAKGRNAANPLPVQVASIEDAYRLTSGTSEAANIIMKKFFPGPLTVVLSASPNISKLITAGSGKIGIRMPDHPAALALIRGIGSPIVATSANISGQPPPITAEEAFLQLEGKIECVLDSGPCRLKVSSTVVDLTVNPPEIIRSGGISLEEILEFY